MHSLITHLRQIPFLAVTTYLKIIWYALDTYGKQLTQLRNFSKLSYFLLLCNISFFLFFLQQIAKQLETACTNSGFYDMTLIRWWADQYSRSYPWISFVSHRNGKDEKTGKRPRKWQLNPSTTRRAKAHEAVPAQFKFNRMAYMLKNAAIKLGWHIIGAVDKETLPALAESLRHG